MENISVFEKDNQKFGDMVYFITNSLDSPNYFIKCQGIIRGRHVKDNNVFYAIELVKIMEVNRNNVINFIHGNHYQTIMEKSLVLNRKKINCIDIIDEINFDDLIVERLRKHHFVVSVCFVSKSISDINTLHDYVYDSIKEYVENINSMLIN